MVPCSHVGHLYKTAVAWRDDDSVISNEYRVAEVWMDQYKHYVFESNGNYSVCLYIFTMLVYELTYYNTTLSIVIQPCLL